MFSVDGYRIAIEARAQFSWMTLDRATKVDLLAKIKLQILKDKRRDESKGEIYCLPTIDEAKTEVSDGDAFKYVEGALIPAFPRYLRTVSLFLIGHPDFAVPVSDMLINHKYRHSRHVSRRPVWDFLDDNYLSVNAKEKERLIEAAKIIVDAEDQLNLFAADQAAMLRLISLRPVVQNLAKYDGYYLAVKTNDFPDRAAIRKFLNLRDDKISEPTTAPPNKSSGNGLRHAFDCFVEAFPHGKNDTVTWKEVEDITGYSRRTICRALKKFDGQMMGAAGGQIRPLRLPSHCPLAQLLKPKGSLHSQSIVTLWRCKCLQPIFQTATLAQDITSIT